MRPGLSAIQDAVIEALPAVHLVTVDDVPRAFLSAAEFAAICGVRPGVIRELIRDGELYVVEDFGTQAWRIPTSEIARWQAKARPLTT